MTSKGALTSALRRVDGDTYRVKGEPGLYLNKGENGFGARK